VTARQAIVVGKITRPDLCLLLIGMCLVAADNRDFHPQPVNYLGDNIVRGSAQQSVGLNGLDHRTDLLLVGIQPGKHVVFVEQVIHSHGCPSKT